MKTFTVVVQFAAGERTDARLRTTLAIQSAVLSWLAELSADVKLIEVAEDRHWPSTMPSPEPH